MSVFVAAALSVAPAQLQARPPGEGELGPGAQAGCADHLVLVLGHTFAAEEAAAAGATGRGFALRVIETALMEQVHAGVSAEGGGAWAGGSAGGRAGSRAS